MQPAGSDRAHGLDEADLIVTREALETLRDQVFVVQCAVNQYREAVDWLLGSLEPLLARPILELRERP
jgi:hypothetical protein